MLGTSEGNIFDAEFGVACSRNTRFAGSPGVEKQIIPSDCQGEVGGQTLGKLKADTGFSSFFVFASPVDSEEIQFVRSERVIYDQGCRDKPSSNDPVSVDQFDGAA